MSLIAVCCDFKTSAPLCSSFSYSNHPETWKRYIIDCFYGLISTQSPCRDNLEAARTSIRKFVLKINNISSGWRDCHVQGHTRTLLIWEPPFVMLQGGRKPTGQGAGEQKVAARAAENGQARPQWTQPLSPLSSSLLHHPTSTSLSHFLSPSAPVRTLIS